VSYHDKIQTKLNDLQKEFFRLFRKSFPDLTDRIEIQNGIIDPDNFCFSVTSESQVFGKLSFDIDDTEITVFSDFDHSHFPTDYFSEEKSNHKRILLTCEQVLNYFSDFITGKIIIEYKVQNGIIKQSIQYYKDKFNPASFSKTNLNEEHQLKSDNRILSYLKRLIIRRQQNDSAILTKKVNWFGEIE
jgi:hypothetical protein